MQGTTRCLATLAWAGLLGLTACSGKGGGGGGGGSPATFGISGIVSGAIATGVTITLSDAGGATTIATAATDASGNYAFTGLPDGSYTLTPSMAGYVFSPTSRSPIVNGADVTSQSFTTVATHAISGTVSGATATGVTITLSDAGGATTIATAATDASGNYAFNGLPDGSYTLTPSMAGYVFSPTSRSPIVNGADVTSQSFTTTATHTISGTVTGATASGVTITLSDASGATTIATGATDASGNYAFTRLLDGSYTLTPSKAGYTFDVPSLSPTVSGADVTGQSFTATAIAYTISGTVSGAIASGVTIALSGAGSATTTTDASGNYAFTGLAYGSYTVTPSKGGGEYAFAPVTRSVAMGASATAQDFTAIDAEWANWIVPAISPSSYQADAGAGTVTDTVTGLVWQGNVDAATYPWSGAKSYCASLSLGGWTSGWRLPTLIELKSIVDYGAYFPAVNASAFPNTPPDLFWSSSPLAGYGYPPPYAWAVSFIDGNDEYFLVGDSYRVRCVRSSAASATVPAVRYTATTDAVTDTVTGLLWQRSVDAVNTYTWAAAPDYCASLSLGSWTTGWRLPTIKELQSIVDVRSYDPAIDTTAFPGTPVDWFWSSSPDSSGTSVAWAVYFHDGRTSASATGGGTSYRVRCVR